MTLISRELNVLSLTLPVLSIIATSPAYAESVFLLQLGTANSEAEAARKFEQIRKTHANTIGDYAYYPREIKSLKNASTLWRIQAGPVSSRMKANQVCADLQTKSTECYVVETAVQPVSKAAPVPTPIQPELALPASTAEKQASSTDELETPTSSGSNATEPRRSGLWPWNWFRNSSNQENAANPVVETLPASEPSVENNYTNTNALTKTTQIQTAAEPPIAQEAPTAAPLPWLTNTSAEAQIQPELAPVTEITEIAENTSLQTTAVEGTERQYPSKNEAKVEVSEAIPVPLSDSQNPVPAAAAEFKPTPGNQRVPLNQWATAHRAIRYLQISTFSSPEEAFSCWKTMQENDGSLKNMGAQALRSFTNRRDNAKISLRVGPVESESHASYVCGIAKRCGIDSLSCRGVAEMAGSAQTLQTPARPSYNTQTINNRATSNAREVSSGKSSNNAGVWIQLGSTPNQAQARQRWERLQAEYPQYFARRQAIVSSPSTRSTSLSRSVYRLRTGPFANREEANKLCTDLMAHNISCLTVTE